jgi:hypothetical protein
MVDRPVTVQGARMQKANVFTRQMPPQPGDLSSAGRRFLAEGDSWFTLGTLNLLQGTNVLLELEFKQKNAIVSWAYPGDTLQRMVDGISDDDFDRALWNRTGGNFASFWEAILLSAGGNDLIVAAEVPPVLNGQPVPDDKRLFLTAAEAAALPRPPGPPGPLRRISDRGWKTLTDHLFANFEILLERKNLGPSQPSPLILHTYAMPAARPSGTGSSPHGWLYPAMQAYGIAPAEMQPVCTELFTRLRNFLLSLDQASGQPQSLQQVHVFDSAGLTDIVPATPGAPGISGDWVNEIHLTAGGYRKMGPPFGRFIDKIVDSYFGPL